MSVLSAIARVQDVLSDDHSISIHSAIELLSNGLASHESLAFDDARALLESDPKLLDIGSKEYEVRYRWYLECLILGLRPAWLELFPKGRSFVATYLEDNIRQCFSAAQLFEQQPTDDAISWWDRLALAVRSGTNEDKLIAGRRAEKKTIEFEQRQLVENAIFDWDPLWMSLEDNTLGYDIKSFRRYGTTVKPFLIEVKQTSKEAMRFFVSRNEWRIASEHADMYRFYIWQTHENHPVILSPIDLMAHVPKDIGVGRWRQAEFDLEAFLKN